MRNKYWMIGNYQPTTQQVRRYLEVFRSSLGKFEKTLQAMDGDVITLESLETAGQMFDKLETAGIDLNSCGRLGEGVEQIIDEVAVLLHGVTGYLNDAKADLERATWPEDPSFQMAVDVRIGYALLGCKMIQATLDRLEETLFILEHEAV